MAVGQTTCSRNRSSLATIVKASPTTTKKNSAQAAVIELHKTFSALNESCKFHRCSRGLRFLVLQVTPTIHFAFYSHNATHFEFLRVRDSSVC